MTTRKLGIVADDLTGAMDSSGYFAGLGFSTMVVMASGFSSDATELVITTNSRTEAPEVARERVRQAMWGRSPAHTELISTSPESRNYIPLLLTNR